MGRYRWLIEKWHYKPKIYFQNSGIEKAFLFDVVSKIYIATDCSPVDMQSYELCCDMIDVVIDLSSIYGYALQWISDEILVIPHPDTNIGSDIIFLCCTDPIQWRHLMNKVQVS